MLNISKHYMLIVAFNIVLVFLAIDLIFFIKNKMTISFLIQVHHQIIQMITFFTFLNSRER